MRFAYAAIVALVAAVILPYGAAASQISDSSDVVAARIAAEQELVSLGISPGDAVFQVGARNYAGSDCPGSGWNCTSATTVVQINSEATLATGSNSFDCTTSTGGSSSNDPGLQRCVVVQTQTTGTVRNSARCVESSSDDPTRQVCKISQTNVGGTNWALIDQRITQSKSMGSQIGDQVAKVRQINGTGDNQSAIVQILNQKQKQKDDRGDEADDGHKGEALVGLPSTLLQKQEAHQRAIVCQGGPLDPCQVDSNGKNVSGVAQTFDQSLSVAFKDNAVAGIIQEQNTCAVPGLGCDGNDPAPKSLARVRQNSTAACNKSGDNQRGQQGQQGQNPFSPCNASGLVQFNRQVATVHGSSERDEDDKSFAAFGGTVTQQQGIAGNPGCLTYGVCAWVDQHTSASGVEHAIQSQEETQKLVAPSGATQSQFGPMFCCATQLPGNPNNINQTLQKKVQTATGTVQFGFIQGHCVNLTGKCAVNETLTQSGNLPTKQNSCNSTACGITISCVGGQDVDGPPCVVSNPAIVLPPQPEPFTTKQCPDPEDPAFCPPIIDLGPN